MTNVAGNAGPSSPAHQWSEDDTVAVGRSCVCAPFVGSVGRIEDGQEQLLLACVDLRVLDDAREVYRCRQDIKQAVQAGPG